MIGQANMIVKFNGLNITLSILAITYGPPINDSAVNRVPMKLGHAQMAHLDEVMI